MPLLLGLNAHDTKFNVQLLFLFAAYLSYPDVLTSSIPHSLTSHQNWALKALRALTGINDPEQHHLGLPPTSLPMGPGAPFQVSLRPSVPVWAGLIVVRVPVYSSVTTMPVTVHGPYLSRPWSVDYFPAWPQPDLISVDLPVDHWVVSDPGYHHQTCSWHVDKLSGLTSSLWICLYLIPPNLSGDLDSGLILAAGPGPALLLPSCPVKRSPCWLGPCPASLAVTFDSLSRGEQLACTACSH